MTCTVITTVNQLYERRKVPRASPLLALWGESRFRSGNSMGIHDMKQRIDFLTLISMARPAVLNSSVSFLLRPFIFCHTEPFYNIYVPFTSCPQNRRQAELIFVIEWGS